MSWGIIFMFQAICVSHCLHFEKIGDTALFNPQWNWDIQILKETAANNAMVTSVHSFVQ